MPGQPFGVYLHVPFCLTRCGYCDFNTYTPAQLVASARTVGCWRCGRSSNWRPPSWTHRRCIPCMWVAGRHRCSGERLATLLDMVRDHFVLAPDAEVSTEANPESTWPEFFATIRAAGYTRVSLGMQSVAPRVLATLDRVHSPGRAAAAATEAIAEGFTHVNLDLIYGTPGSPTTTWCAQWTPRCRPVWIMCPRMPWSSSTARHWLAGFGVVSWPRPMTTCWRIATSWSMLGCRRPGLPGTRCPIGVDRAASAGTTWVIGTVASGGAQVRRARLHWRDTLVECQAPQHLRRDTGRGDVAGSGLRAAGRRRFAHRRRVAEGPAAPGLPLARLGAAERERAEAVLADGLLDYHGDRLVLTGRGRLLADAVVRTLLG